MSDSYTVGRFVVVPRWEKPPAKHGRLKPCTSPPVREWAARRGLSYRQLVRLYEQALNRRLPGRPKPYDIEGMIRHLDAAFRRGDLIAYLEFNELSSGGFSPEPEAQPEASPTPPPARQREEQPTVWCDFEKVSFKCKHCPNDPKGEQKRELSDVRFWLEGRDVKNNLQRPPAGSQRQHTEELQVVASHRKASSDKIKIKLEGGPGYGCDYDHPFIDVYDRGHKESQVFEGRTEAEIDVVCKLLPPLDLSTYVSPFKLIRYYFFPRQQVNYYEVSIRSCGLQKDHKPAFKSLSQTIAVYPLDTYKLSLSIPPVGKASFSKDRNKEELSAELAYHRRQASVASDGSASYADKHGGVARDADGRLSTDVDPVDHPLRTIAASFAFTRNGGDIEGVSAIGEAINALVNLQNEIKGVMNFIQDFQPAVGWKFAFELELFKGELSYEWGYREWKDHTVFKWWAFTINMTLFYLKLELSFGARFSVWLAKITAEVFGNVQMDVAVEAVKEASPDDPAPWELKLKGEPKGELGIRAALGADWVKAEGKLTCGFPFEAVCKCSTKEPFGIDWKLDFTGIQAVVSGHMKWRGSFEKKWKIVEPRYGWKQGRFPGGDKEKKGLPTKQGRKH